MSLAGAAAGGSFAGVVQTGCVARRSGAAVRRVATERRRTSVLMVLIRGLCGTDVEYVPLDVQMSILHLCGQSLALG
jgi:hypothetical protein